MTSWSSLVLWLHDVLNVRFITCLVQCKLTYCIVWYSAVPYTYFGLIVVSSLAEGSGVVLSLSEFLLYICYAAQHEKRTDFFPSFSVQGSVFSHIDALLGEFRVGGGVHDSYTSSADWWDLLLPLALASIDTRSRLEGTGTTAFRASSERHWQSGVNGIAKVPKQKVFPQWDSKSNPRPSGRQSNAPTHSPTNTPQLIFAPHNLT